MKYFIITIALIIIATGAAAEYRWLQDSDNIDRRVAGIPVPEGMVRPSVSEDSFALWLRSLPLKPDSARVRLYDGALRDRQDMNYRVIDIDVGSRDLQQCADAVMRLRSEYLFSRGLYDSISFNFTSGDPCPFKNWIKGWRPKVDGTDVKWSNTGAADTTYESFREYLVKIFMYAGSYSLEKELREVENLSSIKIGDVFIRGGFPGHAMIVVDLAENPENGETAVLLAQSFMPAQSVHIVTNLNDADLSPWYVVGKGSKLETPDYNFKWSELKRF